MAKKLVVFYTNCQSQGIVHFLNQTPLAEHFEFSRQNNWQLILGEQSREEFFEKLVKADAVIYQPTGDYQCVDKYVMPPSDELLATFCPESHQTSFVYQYNDGFFPLIKHGGWKTSVAFRQRAHLGRDHPMARDDIYRDYNAGRIHFACARRFAECLAEQARREEMAMIRTVPFIVQNFQREQMFVSENHPASALYIYLAREIADRLCRWFELPLLGHHYHFEVKGPNSANMSGELPVHEAVIRELGLTYPATEKAHEYYREKIDELFRDIRSGNYSAPTFDSPYD